MKYAPTPVILQWCALACEPLKCLATHAIHKAFALSDFARATGRLWKRQCFKSILNGRVKMRILGASARPFELFSNEVKKRAKRCTASVRGADTQIPYSPTLAAFAGLLGGTRRYFLKSTIGIIEQLLNKANRCTLLPVDMSQISRKLGANVRRIRLENGFTQKELCRKLKVDVSYFSNLENGRKNPTLATVDKIARTLGVRVEDLVC